MKNYAHIILGILCVLCPHIAAADVYISVGENYTENIDVDDSLTITNYGTLSGNVIFMGPYAVKIYNYGVISGNFDCGAKCHTIIQEIHNSASVNPIPNLSGHIIFAYNDYTDHIDMADLISAAGNAYEIHLGDGVFEVGTNVPVFPNNIKITSDGVEFLITGIPDDLSQPLITHVVNSNVISQTTFLSEEYAMTHSAKWIDDSLYIFNSLYTNYEVVIGDALGNYLDSLRDENPNDKLIVALDAIDSRADMAMILEKSVRTNPINLMNPIISFNSHDLIKFEPGTVITPFYLHSDDFVIMGANINLSGKISDSLMGNIGFIGGAIDYSSDYDDYSGALYGGNIGIQYIDDRYYVNAYGKFIYAMFNDLDVFHNGTVIRNPSGFGADLVTDFGLVYRVYDDINVIPFVGVRADYASVVSETKTDFNLRMGAKVENTDNTDGNSYSAGGKIFVQTDGAIYGGGYMDMMSNADGVGGGFDVGVLYDDMGISYRIALNRKIIF